jgi:hypothetical protein
MITALGDNQPTTKISHDYVIPWVVLSFLMSLDIALFVFIMV